MSENALIVQQDSHVRRALEEYKNHLRNVLKVMHVHSLFWEVCHVKLKHFQKVNEID